METTIYPTVKGSTMEQVFDKAKNISIRQFTALNLKSESDYRPNKRYRYEVIARHPDGTYAMLLFNEAVRKIEGKQTTEDKMKEALEHIIERIETVYISQPRNEGKAVLRGFLTSLRDIAAEAIKPPIETKRYEVTAGIFKNDKFDGHIVDSNIKDVKTGRTHPIEFCKLATK